MRKVLVAQVAALGRNLFAAFPDVRPDLARRFRAASAVFPALTCPAQATFRTARQPGETGVTFNGFYSRETRRPAFWEQSAGLCRGPRIWERFRARGGRTAMFFWQQSLGESVDFLLSPAPIHTHGGGLVDAVYSQPDGLYDQLSRQAGRKFKLHSYWGPLAGAAASEFIAAATAGAMRLTDGPQLIFTYLPHLDYALQKYGPAAPQARAAFDFTLGLLENLEGQARAAGYDFLFWGDYAIGEARRAIRPNQLLARGGLMKTREIRGRLYPDFYQSRAFAVVDHEIAQVYISNESDIEPTRRALLESAEGDFDVLTGAEAGLAPTGGELVLVGRPGAWFAYPWWENRRSAPDYATHIDIHNKPGYDPCELFWGIPPFTISTDPAKIKGTHGLAGAERKIAWHSSLEFASEPSDLLDLSRQLNGILDHD